MAAHRCPSTSRVPNISSNQLKRRRTFYESWGLPLGHQQNVPPVRYIFLSKRQKIARKTPEAISIPDEGDPAVIAYFDRNPFRCFVPTHHAAFGAIPNNVNLDRLLLRLCHCDSSGKNT
jgi:hypothetical protein